LALILSIHTINCIYLVYKASLYFVLIIYNLWLKNYQRPSSGIKNIPRYVISLFRKYTSMLLIKASSILKIGMSFFNRIHRNFQIFDPIIILYHCSIFSLNFLMELFSNSSIGLFKNCRQSSKYQHMFLNIRLNIGSTRTKVIDIFRKYSSVIVSSGLPIQFVSSTMKT